MSDTLKQFEEKVRNAENAPLVDSLIEHAQKMMDDTRISWASNGSFS